MRTALIVGGSRAGRLTQESWFDVARKYKSSEEEVLGSLTKIETVFLISHAYSTSLTDLEYAALLGHEERETSSERREQQQQQQQPASSNMDRYIPPSVFQLVALFSLRVQFAAAIEVCLKVVRTIRIGLLSIEERCGIVFVIGHGEPNSDEAERPRGNEVNPLSIKPLTSGSCENNDVFTTYYGS
ncbi:hypothetical protein HZH66_000533 [Vespula vulgaris]|uniref:Uncharacterized protein n=1 Tax=Vespula vulgaris TaxID=7454 RepID=A0A834KRP0_VESVU|nr:hypothetical protein HZH66_000533 [Vespula vulgaris]